MLEFLFGKAKKKRSKSKRTVKKRTVKRRTVKRTLSQINESRINESQLELVKNVAVRNVAANGGDVKEQAAAAGAAVADAAETMGATKAQVIYLSQRAAAEVASGYYGQSSPIVTDISNNAAEVAEEVASHPLKDNFDYDLNALDFGKKRSRFGSCKVCRKSKFGSSECSVLPNTYQDCTNYMSGSSYPCYSTSTGCRKRTDKQPRHQIYLKKVVQSPAINQSLPIVMPSVIEEIVTPVPTPFSTPIFSPQFRNTSDDFNYHNYTKFCGSIKSKSDCDTRQNCTWNAGSVNKCRARKGVITNPSGEYFEGKEGPELPVMEFGKKRKTVKKSKKVKKIPKAILRKCKKLRIRTTIKRGNKRVYKSLKVLKRLIKLKLKKLK